ncbi:Aldo-keto reductase IolS [Neolewinella maritima]|uniref:Aldo-keto reductase IolS n=1 Tax=Neolewinella maritima TaxID=1383882 RepID=A0ABN8F652_9BACT|nr:aldo/keto reductase [Neolewinella maritima]CAH1002431.1 Aldo-keto reductase IolS [Neolewinella maritima]
MDTHPIGSLGVTSIGIGCNNFGWHIDDAAAHRVVDAALDEGVNHFDTADLYGEGESERFLGRALGTRRKEVVIASKFGLGTNARPDNVFACAEASLGRLGTDYIDLYYLHRPDPETPIADTLGALSRLVEQGKVREIGCSGFSAAQLREAAAVDSPAHFAAVQNEFSLLSREPTSNGVLQACGELGIAFIPYFPLKSGLLTGKYRLNGAVPSDSRLGGKEGSRFEGSGNKLLTTDNLTTVEQLIAWSEAKGHTVLDLAFAYLLAHKTVGSVIAGATKPSQVAGNVRASEWRLTEAEVVAVEGLLG